MSKKILLTFFALTIPSCAWGVSDNLKEMCIDDYLAFCNQYDLGTPELTTCMQNAVDQLSEGCRNALKDEGFKKGPETSNEVSTVTEGSPLIEEKTKVKNIIQKKSTKAVDRPKKSARSKFSSNSNRSTSLSTKPKTLVASYPKWLDVPRSEGSSISVYGNN